MTSTELYHWTTTRIAAECRRAWLDYDRAMQDRYTSYFQDHPTLADPKQAWSAKDLESALPPGRVGLSERLPHGRHQHHLSGKSSQILALALLGDSAERDPSHRWLWDAFSPMQPNTSTVPVTALEAKVSPDLLGERGPGRTSIDYLVEDSDVVICIECQWREDGIGACSCADHEGCDPAAGSCSKVIRDERPIYWETARDVFFLPDRLLALGGLWPSGTSRTAPVCGDLLRTA